MLEELQEHAAVGRIAEIYDEIRRFSAVPYVSSLQRHLATLPGVLEWAWEAIRPAMVCGVIPEAAWRLAQSVRLAPTTSPPSVEPAARAAIRNIAANFVRVSPVNLLTGACLSHLLKGAHPHGPGFANAWTPPPMLPPMQGNVDPAALPADQQAVLMRFATQVDNKPFIPALYRQIAHWPDVLVWVADELTPHFSAGETAETRRAFRAAAYRAAPDIVANLPGLPPMQPPDPATTARLLAIIDRYAETSPEMTMFGNLILAAFPA